MIVKRVIFYCFILLVIPLGFGCSLQGTAEERGLIEPVDMYITGTVVRVGIYPPVLLEDGTELWGMSSVVLLGNTYRFGVQLGTMVGKYFIRTIELVK